MSSAGISAIVAIAVSAAPPQEVTIAGKPYVKLATRAQTEKAMRAQLTGVELEWGPWQWLGPFALPGGSKQIATVVDAEEGRALAGSIDATRWRELDNSPAQGGSDGFGSIDLSALATASQSVIYLHRRVVASRPSKLRVNVGSDDGLRLWLDGRLLVEAAMERGFEPEQHVLELEFARGEHHLLAKVAQDAGGWAFKLAPDVVFDRVSEAALDWQLQLDFPDAEARHWRIATLPIPEQLALEVGGIDLLPDGRPIVSTRRGDVFIVDGAFALPPKECKLTLFASGLHESLGVAIRPDARAKAGWCAMVVQRGELTRLVDLDGDDDHPGADLYETACDAWQVSGNYHEYAFGPRYDADGNAWVTLNLGHTGGETVMGALLPTRGCAVRVRPDGTMEVMADGLRSPDGVNWLPGLGAAYTDNQGDYVATNKLSLLLPGSFHGHQASLPFRSQEHAAFACPSWKKGDPVPPRQEPAIWFPYSKMGQSTSDFVVDDTGGKFGPFSGQLFVGDQTHATVMRVCLETVHAADGDFVQGACFPFRAGFKSGVHRLRFTPDGSLLVGLTDRGWGSRGGWRDGLERVLFTGDLPFELLAVRAAPDGFDLEFTQDLDPKLAADPASWQITSWTYEYHPDYGSAEMETAAQRVTEARVVDPRRVHLAIEKLRAGFVHEITAAGVRSRGGAPLLHDTAWYTLQRVPH
jgi:hypothetical protein